jgi:hypothetical protein
MKDATDNRMQVKRWWWAGWLLLALATPPAWGQSTNAPAKAEFSNFKLVAERNIFNPKRQARSSGRRESRPVPKTESLTLVGTMHYEQGLFAFFDGTKSDYRQAVKPAQAIAGCTLTEISPTGVRLAVGTNEIRLLVGQQLRREEAGAWEVASADAGGSGYSRPDRPRSLTTPVPGAVSAAPAGAEAGAQEGEPADVAMDTPPPQETVSQEPEPGNAGTDDPVLKRLMQRREQELNR